MSFMALLYCPCIYDIMAIGVYYQSFFIFRRTHFGKIVEMDMTVDQIPGLKHPHEPKKGLKALVAKVLPVMDAPGSGMGQKHVKKTPPEQAVKQERREKAQNLAIYLEIGVLVFSPVVAHGSPQPCHDKAPLPHYPASDMDDAVPVVSEHGARLFRKSLQMVVPEHEEQRLVQAGNNKIQIVQGKIPRAENQIYPFKTFLYRGGVHQGINLIGNTRIFIIVPRYCR
jgi:hypothetical protein